MITKRLEQLGLEPNDLVVRYCEVRRAKGDESATPRTRRTMIYKILKGDASPTLDTFQDIVEALDGKVMVQWQNFQLESLGGS